MNRAHAYLSVAFTLAVAACAAPADEAASSASAVIAPPEPEKPRIIGNAIGQEQTALSTLDTARVGVWLDVPGLYMCGAKILLAADAPEGLESTLVQDQVDDFFAVDFTVRRVSPREVRLETAGDPIGWSGVLYLTTSDGRTIADTFAGASGTIEQLYCRKER